MEFLDSVSTSACKYLEVCKWAAPEDAPVVENNTEKRTVTREIESKHLEHVKKLDKCGLDFSQAKRITLTEPTNQDILKYKKTYLITVEGEPITEKSEDGSKSTTQVKQYCAVARNAKLKFILEHKKTEGELENRDESSLSIGKAFVYKKIKTEPGSFYDDTEEINGTQNEEKSVVEKPKAETNYLRCNPSFSLDTCMTTTEEEYNRSIPDFVYGKINWFSPGY